MVGDNQQDLMFDDEDQKSTRPVMPTESWKVYSCTDATMNSKAKQAKSGPLDSQLTIENHLKLSKASKSNSDQGEAWTDLAQCVYIPGALEQHLKH